MQYFNLIMILYGKELQYKKINCNLVTTFLDPTDKLS